MTDPTLAALEVFRRLMLAHIIAEVCGGDPSAVHSPVCPMCSEGPVGVLPGWQALCGNDGCPVFMWNPLDTPEEFRRQAQPLRLQQLDHATGEWVDVDLDE